MSRLSSPPRVTVICGHYGAGKTTLAVNLAIAAKRSFGSVYLADADIVNPYFRAADSAERLKDAGVTPLIPLFANSNVDIPCLPPMLDSVVGSEDDARVYIDVGGDDGAVVLGRYRDALIKAGYEMIFTVNRFRPLIADAAVALSIMEEIERSSGLGCTCIVNNSCLGAETTREDILSSVPYAEEIAEAAGLPLAGHSYLVDAVGDLSDDGRFSNLTMIPLFSAVRTIF